MWGAYYGDIDAVTHGYLGGGGAYRSLDLVDQGGRGGLPVVPGCAGRSLMRRGQPKSPRTRGRGPPRPRRGRPLGEETLPTVDRTSPSGGDRSSEEGSSEESSPSAARSSGEEEAHGTCDNWERRSRRRVVDPCRDGERPPSSESAGRPQAEGE